MGCSDLLAAVYLAVGRCLSSRGDANGRGSQIAVMFRRSGNRISTVISLSFAFVLAFSVQLNAPLAMARDLETAGSLGSKNGVIELYDKAGHYPLNAIPDDARSITMEVPEAFRYGSTAATTRTRGVEILTYYPSLSSPKDLENAAYGLNCVGLCNGRILLLIEYNSNLLNTSSPNSADYVAHEQLYWKRTPPYPPNVSVHDITTPSGFDGGFERSYSGARDSEIVFFRNGPDGSHYDLAATCVSNPQRTTCILHFSLKCDAKLFVTVNGLDSSYLDRSSDIVTRVNEFVSSMIKYPVCKG
jgi:hypothetical protein